MKPFVEVPSVLFVRAGERGQRRGSRRAFADRRERHDPETADERPATAIVILVDEILLMAPHVSAPKYRGRFDRIEHDSNRVRLVDARVIERTYYNAAPVLIGESKQHGEH